MVIIFLQPVVSHLHNLSIFILDNPFFLFEGTTSVHQVTWNTQECGVLHFNKLSCFEYKEECAHYFLKAHPHCKSLGQIGGVARPSGLMSVDLAGRLVLSILQMFFSTPCRHFQFFQSRFLLPTPIVIAGPSNLILR